MNEQDYLPVDPGLMEAEAMVCGSILKFPQETIREVTAQLKPEDFVLPASRHFFSAVMDLKSEHKQIDEYSIRNQLQKKGTRIAEEDFAYMKNKAVTPDFVSGGAAYVRDSALERKLQDIVVKVSDRKRGLAEDRMQEMLEKLNRLNKQQGGTVDVLPVSAYEYIPPKWVLEPYFQMGKGTMIQADPGVGKTAFMCAVAGAVTTGRGFLGLKVQAPGNVIMLTTEDDPGVIRGRIEASGGDVNRVFLVTDTEKYRMNSPHMEQLIEDCQARMIIFDPIQQYLGEKVDMHRANETRPILSALFETCARQNCACVLVSHLGKSLMGKSTVNQSLGSVDIPGAMRSILHIVRDPRAKGQNIALHVKSSNAARGKSIAYSIGDKGGVHWLELTDDTLEDLAAAQKDNTLDYEDNPLLPVLQYIRDNNHENCFWSYEDFRTLCMKQLGYVPAKDGRDLQRLLTRPFLSELLQRDNIQIVLGERFRHSRGFRLLYAPDSKENGNPIAMDVNSESYRGLMNMLDSQEPS